MNILGEYGQQFPVDLDKKVLAFLSDNEYYEFFLVRLMINKHNFIAKNFPK